jgi:hypothetical protein
MDYVDPFIASLSVFYRDDAWIDTRLDGSYPLFCNGLANHVQTFRSNSLANLT